MNKYLSFTRITSSTPKLLTKVFGYKNGKLEKKSAASIQEGVANRVIVPGLSELAKALDSLGSNEAISWGVTEAQQVKITTKNRALLDPYIISRSRKYFTFANCPGIMMLDHDGIMHGEINGEELRNSLISACPVLENAPMFWRPSSSYGIRDANNELLTNTAKARIYIPVTKASDIPTAGQKLSTLLWAKGHGWYEVSKSGRLLDRCLIDASVFQPERLDFAALPILNDGLRRDAVEGIIFGDALGQFDLNAIRVDVESETAAARARSQARRAISGESQLRRSAWAAEGSPRLAESRNISAEKARSVLTRASESGVLMGDFELTSEDGTTLAVSEVLADADYWHGKRFADPLGDYAGDLRIATAMLKGVTRPTLMSFGHGGQRFELRQQSHRVETGRGLKTETTDSVLSAMRSRQELFDFGDAEIAYVGDGGRARAVTVDFLADYMGRIIEFYSLRQVTRRDGTATLFEQAEDAPMRVASAIVAKVNQRGFDKLLGVVTAPTLRSDGSILSKPGYDQASGLYLYTNGAPLPVIPVEPSVTDAKEALRVLWKPFSEFPFVDDVSRGVLLQALITACIRGALPAAPGVGIDAPAAGTGKTLLARSIGALAAGAETATFAPLENDDEMRKRLFAALLSGYRVLLFDNVREPLGGAALDAFLTAPMLTERILGGMNTSSLPYRAMLIVTGNNLRMTGDTCRRILTIRIDAGVEKAYMREFKFDPYETILSNRFELVAAALTIVRAWIAAGRPKAAKGKIASFELWDELVRQPLCWLRSVINDDDDLPDFTDPIKSTESSFELDPETAKLTAFAFAWHNSFKSEPKTLAMAIQKAFSGDENLKEAIEDVAGFGNSINRKSLGKWLARYADQIVGGLKFVRGKNNSNGVALWSVVRTQNADVGNPEIPLEPGTF